MMTAYSWGVDGFGRQFICHQDGREILLCMLPGQSPFDGIELLEMQESA